MGYLQKLKLMANCFSSEDKLVCPARPEYLEDFDVVNDGIPEGVDLMSLRQVWFFGVAIDVS